MYKLLSEWTKKYNLNRDELKMFSPDAVEVLMQNSNGLLTEITLVGMLRKDLEAKVNCHQLTLHQLTPQYNQMEKTNIVWLENQISWKIEHYTHFL